jgi:predicted nucleotidyltransferase
MLSELELRAIGAFYPEPTCRTVREIAKASGYSYERAHTALRSLERKGIARSKRIGNVIAYDLITRSDEALLGFMMVISERARRFKEKHASVYEAVQEFADKVDPEICILFGSYSKGYETELSDIDLLFVTDREDTAKQSHSLSDRLNKDITAIDVPKKAFRAMERHNPGLFYDILHNGIVVKGYERYFELVYRWDLWSTIISDGSSDGGSSRGRPLRRGAVRVTSRRRGRTCRR